MGLKTDKLKAGCITTMLYYIMCDDELCREWAGYGNTIEEAIATAKEVGFVQQPDKRWLCPMCNDKNTEVQP